MNAKIEILKNEVRKLSPDEQALLMDELHVMLHEPDAEIDKAWKDELGRRQSDLDSGAVKAVPIEDIPWLRDVWQNRK